MKWKCLGATTAKLQSGRPHKLTERGRQVLKGVEYKNRLSLVAALTTEFQTAFASNDNTITVSWELHELTMHNAKRRLEWCKARRHRNLEL